jgi:TolA-binding protein
MQELQRQGKTPRLGVWLAAGLLLMAGVLAAVFWYRANLQVILEDKYQDGLALKDSGRYEEALEVFQEITIENPGFLRTPEALFETGETLDIYLERYNDALLTYLLLERDYPAHPLTQEARKQIAELYKYRLDDCSQAISAYQRVLDSTEGEGDRWQYEVADCYFRLNNFEQARIEFEGLQKRSPDSELNAEVQYRIAVTYDLEGKLPEAAAAYRLVDERWPESTYALEARFGLATVLEEQEELRQSLEIFEALVDIYPKTEVLQRKIEQVRARIEKKKNAI